MEKGSLTIKIWYNSIFYLLFISKFFMKQFISGFFISSIIFIIGLLVFYNIEKTKNQNNPNQQYEAKNLQNQNIEISPKSETITKSDKKPNIEISSIVKKNFIKNDCKPSDFKYFEKNGNIYTSCLNNEKELKTSGLNFYPVISGDYTKIAFLTVADKTNKNLIKYLATCISKVKRDERNEICIGEGSDIWKGINI